jgi:hypothetical protein
MSQLGTRISGLSGRDALRGILARLQPKEEAKEAMANPVRRAEYQAAAASKGMRPFDLAVSDFYHGHKQGMLEGPA